MTGRVVRVVVADDQTVVREGIVTLLGLLPGLDVVGAAGDGEEAVRLVAETSPDVVLMDLRMPRCDGAEATRRIRRDHPGTQVVVLTTFGDDDSLFPALQAGARGYLTKDAGSEEILRAIEDVVAGQAGLSPQVQRRLLERLSQQGASFGTAASVDPGGGGRAGASIRSGDEGEPAALRRDGLGAASEADRAESADRVGVDRHGADAEPGAEQQPQAGTTDLPDGLTAREAEVLGLVADGLSNAEIATRLFVSHATVKTHINNLFAKTGVRDRAQAVRYAYLHGINPARGRGGE
ncbi:response regulator transcription factor [Streptomyces sp. ICBB 8177]|uniref:response regulator transcription factor n=1 Tax=Streptomyces sp. ICBB 8177 TaxID=563922 RepID=UPI000D684554|nr:response regulator transcription factor [Streptomyces sp. ICBB 8177]PWI45206.1 DNA-binding response regulator [Streptomyces sp. ICBB 8177]